MAQRTLVIRVPLNDDDPDDIVAQIDSGDVDPTELVVDREDEVVITLEVA